jgi:multiple sugar transport system substrate-binding protein
MAESDDTTDDAPSTVSRRDFLKTGAAGVAGATLLGGSAPYVHARSQPVEISYAWGPDDSGTLQPIIDDFNREHDGEIRVSWHLRPGASGARYRQLVSDFEAGAARYSVFGADSPWTASLVRRGWAQNLTSRFRNVYNADQFVDAAIQSAAHKLRIYGVPWYTDAGVFFYRRDLLEQNGFSDPPDTWNRLGAMAQQIVNNAEGVEHGFVFQGDAYEGGVTNALEYIWNAGGRVMSLRSNTGSTMGQNTLDPNVIKVNSEDVAAGLATARGFIEDGVTPAEVTSFREEEAWVEFLSGRSVFMRNWPYVYGLVDAPETTERLDTEPIGTDQIGVAPLPSGSTDRRGYSCLGGWNLMINNNVSSRKKDAAWTFVKYLTEKQQQRRRAVGGGFLPTRTSLYDDPELQKEAPGIELSREAVHRARVRPVSPLYPEMSPRIATAFTRTLRGDSDPRASVRRLERELTVIMRNAR